MNIDEEFDKKLHDGLDIRWREVEGDDRLIPKIGAKMDKFVMSVGNIIMWFNVILVIAIVSQVGMRYTFDLNFPKLDEIQWHFYALTTMFGVSYALTTDSHVRVDILRLNFSHRAQRVVEILGLIILLLPFCYMMIDQGFDYFQDSYRVNERSDSPTGLPARWALKAVIALSFVMLVFAIFARLIHDIYILVLGLDERAERSGLRTLFIMWAIFAAVAFGLVQLVETPEEVLVVIMFVSFVAFLFSGFPVAWVLAGIGVLFAGIAYMGDNDMLLWTGMEATFTGLDYLTLGAVVNRVYAVMSNAVLVALPMFIFMGLMLDESGVAQRLMTSMQRLFGTMRGGLAITVTAIGIILAASTGIVGASVVLLGLLSMPAMIQQKYSKSLASGVVASSGTLGILIPPSIMLVIMADQMALSVGDLFMAAVFPGLLIGALYIGYIVIIAIVKSDVAPLPDNAKKVDFAALVDVFKAVLPPVALIFAVLGSIFAGVATPTEASGMGAAGATLLALAYRKLTWAKVREVTKNTFNTSGLIK